MENLFNWLVRNVLGEKVDDVMSGELLESVGFWDMIAEYFTHE